MPGTPRASSHLILRTSLRRRHSYCPRFIDEETKVRSLCHLTKINSLQVAELGLELRSVKFQSSALLLSFAHEPLLHLHSVTPSSLLGSSVNSPQHSATGQVPPICCGTLSKVPSSPCALLSSSVTEMGSNFRGPFPWGPFLDHTTPQGLHLALEFSQNYKGLYVFKAHLFQEASLAH